MKPRILQNCPLSAALEAALAQTYDVAQLSKQDDPAAFLAAHGAEFAGLATDAPAGASAETIAALPNLRVIASHGIGLDKIDLEGARRRGIQVAGTPGVLNDCVADLAIGLMIDAARRMSAADRFVRLGRWQHERFPLSTRVSGKRLGIVGLGRIGRTVAKRAAGFDMEIRYADQGPVEGVAFGFEPSVEALAQWADFLVVTVAGGPATRHLVSAAVIEALGPGGFLVNVSRGTVVDQEALIAALSAGRIAGAALDVYADEPNVPQALMACENAVLVPHVASATAETRKAMEDLVVANLNAFFETGNVLTPAF